MPPVLAEEQAVAMVAGGDSQRTMPDLARLHENGDQGQLDAAMARWRHETERREQQLRDVWKDDHVHVDGRRVPARRLAGQHTQAMVFEHDHRQVMVTANGVGLSGLELTATSAIEPLLDEMIRRSTTRRPTD